MNPLLDWLARQLWQSPALAPEQKRRLDAWKLLPRKDLALPFETTRCVVVDVETSGLNLRQDRLISIGAVAVVNGRIALGDSYSIVLHQEAVSERDNILLHEIGGSAQREGMPAVDALLGFLEFVGKDPLVAFHVMFDKTMIRRAVKRYLGFNFKHPWLDLAYVMPGLNPAHASRLRTLDDWNGNFEIHNDARHNALADALVTAQLYLIALEQAGHNNINCFEGLIYMEKLQHSLRSSG